jgi:arsenate reductase
LVATLAATVRATHCYNCHAGFAMLRGPTEYAIDRSDAVITLYGIKNCDTVKKARKWLDTHGIDYQFHDFREDGLDADVVARWVEELGWQNLLNRRSTSWRSLDEQIRLKMNDELARTTVLSHPTLITRPLLDTGQQRYAGFSAASYAKIFNAHTL